MTPAKQRTACFSFLTPSTVPFANPHLHDVKMACVLSRCLLESDFSLRLCWENE